MARWLVQVTRIPESEFAIIEVEAETREGAMLAAEERAGEIPVDDWEGNDDAEINATMATRLSP